VSHDPTEITSKEMKAAIRDLMDVARIALQSQDRRVQRAREMLEALRSMTEAR
jgi:hypothetical protein